MDALVREIVRGRRAATPDDIERIIGRMETAPFNPDRIRVRVRERGTSYLVHTLGAEESSLVYHLVKRVAIEAQWAQGTSAQQYLADLRWVMRAPSGRLVVYERGGEAIAAAIAPTEAVMPAVRRGVGTLPLVIVVSSADRGMIRTGYQFSDLSLVDIPPEAVWLR